MTARHPARPGDSGAAAAAQWPLWSTTVQLVVTDPTALSRARALVDEYLAAVDLACSRFREDSELVRLAAHPGVPVRISALLADYLRAALAVAESTGGDVDPTVGAAMIDLGYDRDFALVVGTDIARTAVPVRVTALRRADWSVVALSGETVTVPGNVLLDLGATAKAVAADRCARLVAAEFGCGALVGLGGDIATAGPAPAGGWQIVVSDGRTQPGCQIRLPGGAAVATSSTMRRRWHLDGRLVHHIVDPRSGVAVDPVWRTVSVAAESCLAANAACTAAVVRGRDALGRLRGSGLPARLVGRDGRVITLGAWPAESSMKEA